MHGAAVRAAVAALGRRFDRKPRSASLAFVAGRPRIKPQLDGAALDQGALVLRVVHSLTANIAAPVSVRTRKTQPALTSESYGAVILINRGDQPLTLFHGDNAVWRVSPSRPARRSTRRLRGRFDIVVKWMNPWWYPPT